MSDEMRSPNHDLGAAVVYDRPVGQSEPVDIERPPKRFSTVAFVALTCMVGLGSWAILLVTRVSSHPDPIVASILFVLLVLSTIFPLQIAYKQELTLDLVVAVVAALLLTSLWAIPVARRWLCDRLRSSLSG